jgi:hypothetical protein
MNSNSQKVPKNLIEGTRTLPHIIGLALTWDSGRVRKRKDRGDPVRNKVLD